LRLLADENVHAALVAGLRADGHDVLSIAEDHSGASDEHVLTLAREQERLLITYDRDFGELLVTEGAGPPPGLIYLRLPRLAVQTALDRLREVIKSGEQQLSEHFIVVAPQGDRWRTLGS
jgi:predicted nuclease of predicted toxin-antitoxin system